MASAFGYPQALAASRLTQTCGKRRAAPSGGPLWCRPMYASSADGLIGQARAQAAAAERLATDALFEVRKAAALDWASPAGRVYQQWADGLLRAIWSEQAALNDAQRTAAVI